MFCCCCQLYTPDAKKSDVVSLITALSTLASNVETDPAVAQLISETLSRYVRDGNDLETQFLSFLKENGIPETSKTHRVLKCLHSDLIFPAYLALRHAFYEEYPFRDLKSSWHVRIQITPTSVIISHIKRERSHEEPGGDYFEFTWLLSLIFDTKVETFRAEVKIIDYYWSDTIKEETKAGLKEAWIPFVSPPRKQLSVIPDVTRAPVHPTEIIKTVAALLARQPMPLHAEHPDLPHSAELQELLGRLNDVLRTVPILPDVLIPVPEDTKKD